MYFIENSYGYPINFNVGSFSLATGSSLAFYDGDNIESKLFANLTGTSTTPTTMPKTILQRSFGKIMSPNNPQNYNNGQDCYYYIVVDTGKRISLDFESFSTAQGSDFLAVYDGPDTTSTPFILMKSTITNKIKFKLFNGMVPFCYEAANGELTSVNYPNNYKTYANEFYLISSLQNFYTRSSLYDGPSESYPLLASYTGMFKLIQIMQL
uniref:CUB domain-containing protein n=1 Tax=Rhabditophanes sp. KR3021 TaxID=114890 RepID=A0AC35TIA1_9BILA